MRRLIYASRYTGEAALSDALRHIVGKSIHNNRIVDVTGFLLAGDGAFLQWLEGPAASVAETFERIGKDPRHGDLTILYDGDAPTRQFRDWNMGQRQLGAEDRGMLAEAGLAGFSPATMDAMTAERLLILAGGRHAR